MWPEKTYLPWKPHKRAARTNLPCPQSPKSRSRGIFAVQLRLLVLAVLTLRGASGKRFRSTKGTFFHRDVPVEPPLFSGLAGSWYWHSSCLKAVGCLCQENIFQRMPKTLYETHKNYKLQKGCTPKSNCFGVWRSANGDLQKYPPPMPIRVPSKRSDRPGTCACFQQRQGIGKKRAPGRRPGVELPVPRFASCCCDPSVPQKENRKWWSLSKTQKFKVSLQHVRTDLYKKTRLDHQASAFSMEQPILSSWWKSWGRW